MYFAQEFIPLTAAILISSAGVMIVISMRLVTLMGLRLALFGAITPAVAVLAITLMAALHPRLQGILITSVAIAFFIVAMHLIPRLRLNRRPFGPEGPRATPVPA